MFHFLRRAAQTWVAKLLLLLLVASFGIWGVSRELISGGSSTTVVTVGDQHVGVNEFHLAYQRQVASLSQQFGMRLTPEQARAFGVEQQVLSQLVAGASLDQLAEDMNLGLSEDRLAQLIGDDPAFKAVNGQFDRELFVSRLRNAGIRQDDYIKERSKVAVRSQIVDAVSNGFTAPKTLVDALKLYGDESRSVDYLLLTNANIEPIKAPADDVLAAWFEGVKQRYRAPEYRKIAYLKLQPADIADAATVTDDQVREAFDKGKDSYRTPESRTIEQLTFTSKDLAAAAETALKSGTSFDQLVSDQGKTASDVLLGEFTKDKVPDQAVADAAFAVSKDGGTTPVVDGSFGPVILRITNIKAETTKNFDEVKDEIRKQLALSNASQEVINVHDHIEDLRAGGATLEDIAGQLKLNAVTVDAVDATGADKDGKEVKDIPAKQQLLGEAFKTEVGVDAPPLPIGNDGYVWFNVREITPDRDRPIAEVREKAVEDWTAEQQKAELAKKADELKAEAQKGTALADIATPLGIAVESKSGITRSTDDPVLGRAGVKAAFSGPVDTVASAVGADPSTQILMKVTEVNSQPTGDVLNNRDAQLTAMANAAGDDILDQMVNLLQTQYGAQVNQTLAEQTAAR
ncbi:peptidylprolyl isomerase PpiC-type domain-containing protein [Rhizobium phaseoli]|uniref:Parvulin-like PPIase n=1 Tax=Rhizobium etli (strain CIAT 652) TaxID=491916 RepID=B3Q0L1_RHIE6|nr:peptidylprolyl isomerase [Rhizobium phaseoli]ACE91215.1 peptidyl-prolyl cis-trans isomerase D signal peptide protein [Rhizobium etli CIAT 652]ANL65868.1 peptidylprolyl isomerase PpiC-type domain-containing protein [Rhizobium phaseoli]ANL78681.1 peptidylprolyl isomerase PpiC-type domain-containing protein [Rhizobium phaseoli]PCD66785.1 peptidylprolyl isomerase [Rhizobium phaseoli]